MRWIKHIVDSTKDEKIAILLSSLGNEGYGAWWRILETVAKQITGKSESARACYPVRFWMQSTGIYHLKKFRHTLEIMRDIELLFAELPHYVSTISALCIDDVLIISIPNLLKYRDEFTRKSGHAPDKLRSKKQNIDIDTDTDTDTDLKDVPCSSEHAPYRPPKKPSSSKAPNPAHAEAKQAIDYYSNAFLAEFGQRPVIDGSKDGAIMKKLCAQYGIETVKGMIGSFMADPDPFLDKTGRTIGMFKAKANALISRANGPPGVSDITRRNLKVLEETNLSHIFGE